MTISKVMKRCIMGISFFLWIFSVCAQQLNEVRVQIDKKEESLEEVINKLSERYELKFAYNPDDLTGIKLTAEDDNKTLLTLLQDKGFRLSERSGSIVIVKLRKQKESNQMRVTGSVKDEAGISLTGVTIINEQSNQSTTTDDNGNYVVVSEIGNQLSFNFVGYQPQTHIVTEQNMNVVLQESNEHIDEVVVVGYGTQRKASVVGAISTIKPEVLQSNQTRSVSNSLAGQISGVIAVQRSGEPGYDDSDFWIRGINTFGANSAPLVLIDGVERSLNNISPEEIESFSVLKDATATAVYGVRGANGVILIQTKRGKQGKPTVTFKTDYGISTPTKLPEFVGAPKYMETINSANELSGLTPLYSPLDIERTAIGYDPDLYPDVNWIDAITRPFATNGRVSVDVNGGSERLQYSLVGAYFDEIGIITTDDRQNYNSQLGLKKYNLRSNVDLNLTSSTKIAMNIGGYITERRAPGVGISTIFSRAMDTPPNYHPVLYSNGQIPKVAARYNPWSDVTQRGYQLRFQSNLETQINITQDIGAIIPELEGLKGSILAAFDAFNTHSQNRTKVPFTYFATGRTEEGELITTNIEQGQEFLNYSRSSGGNRTMYLETRLNYNRTLNDIHHLDGLFLFNLRDFVAQDAGTSILALPYRNTGIAGRTAYSYADKYFAEFNFGYNGSENFKRGLRFGFFPSFALGWMPSNEEFFMGYLDVISKLKFRGSWGLVGNDQIINDRRFAYISTIEKSPGYAFGYNANFNYGTGWREGDFGVDNMTWETAEKINIGTEIGLFNDAVHIQADWFKEKRRDIFMQRKTIPETAGYNLMPYANFGKVDNKGFEVEVLVNKNFSENWFLSARGNFTYAKNTIVEYDEPQSLISTTRARTGQSMNQHYGLEVEGLYQFSDFEDVEKGVLKQGLATPMFGPVKPGDIKYKDLNKDGVIDSYDEAPIGKPYVPQVIVGFGINTRYKNVDLGFLFQGASDFTNMLQGSTLVPGSGGGGTGNIYANVDDRWDPENPSSNVIWPRLSATESANNMRNSTWWLVDASYLRLKNIEIGYSLREATQQKLRVKNARIFARGSNLLTFSYFKMWDPEIGSQNGLKYPLSKIVSAGIEITF